MAVTVRFNRKLYKDNKSKLQYSTKGLIRDDRNNTLTQENFDNNGKSSLKWQIGNFVLAKKSGNPGRKSLFSIVNRHQLIQLCMELSKTRE